jgi:hypothetical protein
MNNLNTMPSLISTINELMESLLIGKFVAMIQNLIYKCGTLSPNEILKFIFIVAGFTIIGLICFTLSVYIVNNFNYIYSHKHTDKFKVIEAAPLIRVHLKKGKRKRKKGKHPEKLGEKASKRAEKKFWEEQG